MEGTPRVEALLKGMAHDDPDFERSVVSLARELELDGEEFYLLSKEWEKRAVYAESDAYRLRVQIEEQQKEILSLKQELTHLRPALENHKILHNTCCPGPFCPVCYPRKV